MTELISFLVSLAVTAASVIIIGNIDGTFTGGGSFFSFLGVLSFSAATLVITFALVESALLEIKDNIKARRETKGKAERLMKAIGVSIKNGGRK